MSWLEGTVRETDGNSCKQRQRLTSLKLTFPVELFSSVIVGGVCEAGIKVDDIYWETVPSKYFEIFFTKINQNFSFAGWTPHHSACRCSGTHKSCTTHRTGILLY